MSTERDRLNQARRLLRLGLAVNVAIAGLLTVLLVENVRKDHESEAVLMGLLLLFSLAMVVGQTWLQSLVPRQNRSVTKP